MPKYVIERTIPNAGQLSAAELRGISQKSVSVLKELGPEIQWIHTYVSDDKIYCVYHSRGPELIAEHARRGGFPADRISQVKTVLDPTSAEA